MSLSEMKISCLCLLSHQEPPLGFNQPSWTNGNCQHISTSGQPSRTSEGHFSCIRPPSNEKEKIRCWKGKESIWENHIFETPVERPEVGILEQKKVELLTLGGCFAGFQPFKMNEAKRMPKHWNRQDWRWGLNDTNDHPWCNCKHSLALGNS